MVQLNIKRRIIYVLTSLFEILKISILGGQVKNIFE